MINFRIFDFLRKIFGKETQEKFLRVVRVNDITKIKNNTNTLYIENRGGKNRWIYLKCPCGCGDIISVNLMISAHPHWILSTNKSGNLDLSPSLNKITGCKSHFFIRDSQIVWA